MKPASRRPHIVVDNTKLMSTDRRLAAVLQGAKRVGELQGEVNGFRAGHKRGIRWGFLFGMLFGAAAVGLAIKLGAML